MLLSLKLKHAVCLISFIGIVVGSQYYDDDEQEDNTLYHDFDPIVEGSSFRYFRNVDQGPQEYKPPQNNVRFGYQNPIRVAPTLPPRQSYSTTKPPFLFPTTSTKRSTTEDYNDPFIASGSNANEQYITPPTRRPSIPTPRQRCPNGSRRNKVNGQCLRVGSSCGENMAFYEIPTESEYGQCDCVQDAKRPLVFHSETGKCYFIFQQAYCKQVDWLIIENNRPTCTTNRCLSFTNAEFRNWNWQDNGSGLNNNGTVALFRDRKCALLGWPCMREGREQLTNNNLLMNPSEQRKTGISLAFDGQDLVCQRDAQRQGNQTPKRDLMLVCKHGLFNKWWLDGRCRNLQK